MLRMEAVIAVGFVRVRTSKLVLPPLEGTYIVGALSLLRLSYFASLTTRRIPQPGAAHSPFAGFAALAPKRWRKGFTRGKYFRRSVLVTTPGTAGSFAALGGTAALP